MHNSLFLITDCDKLFQMIGMLFNVMQSQDHKSSNKTQKQKHDRTETFCRLHDIYTLINKINLLNEAGQSYKKIKLLIF